MSRPDETRPHSHTVADTAQHVVYDRDPYSAPRINEGPELVRGQRKVVQHYVDHAGRPTAVREWEGKTDVFHGPDVVDWWPSGPVKTKWTLTQEALADSKDWKTTGDRFKMLTDQWKFAGRADASTESVLGDQFFGARQRFYDSRKQYFDQREREQAGARRAKERIVGEARSLARSTDWRATGDRFKALMDQWKAAGRASRDDEDKLWREFNDARTQFNDARQRSFADREREQKAAASSKRFLVSRAESIARSSDLRAAGDQMRSLMAEWKKVGRAPRDEEDRLWQQFRAAQDQLHRRKESERQERERTQSAAKSKKQALVSRAMGLTSGPDFKMAQQQMRGLSEEWKAAGRASRDDEDALWQQFNQARERLRANAQAAYEQGKRERAARLQESIVRKRAALAYTENRIYELQRRLSEILSRPEPRWDHPHRWDIANKRNVAVSNMQSKIGDAQGRRQDLISQISDMESKWRSMT